MPSTQSDGVQAKVVADYPDTLFISIETTGDGEANVRSRVQMLLYEARRRARSEFEQVLAQGGVDLETARQWVSSNAKQADAMRRWPPMAACSATSVAAEAVRAIRRRA
jgi:hypothetical protein